METNAPVNGRAQEWKKRLLLTTGILLLAETLTGFSIWLLPFSISNQAMVLLHTIVGIVSLVPFAWYQIRHWDRYRSLPLTHELLTGYFATLATVVLMLSGVVLTWQGLFGTKISHVWDLVHIVATFALLVSVLPHVIVPVTRALRGKEKESQQPILAGQRRFGIGLAVGTVVVLLIGVLAAWAYKPVPLNNSFPKDYSYFYGKDKPFAPSQARTITGGAIDPRTLSGSESCGTAGCHENIVKEWRTSAHRWSAMDAGFQKVQLTMAKQNGSESTRYCGGCHDPISLFSGTKNINVEHLTGLVGYQEGVSCLVCHSVKSTDVKGNATYVITQPAQYMFDLKEGKSAQLTRNFLIRAYPREHVADLQHNLFKSPEFCAACHKQFIDEQINQVGWVQLQNQYDNWRTGKWNHKGDPKKTIECRECHMPLQNTADPGNGDAQDYNRTADDGRHRSHRFLGANQVMPLLLKLPGAEEHVKLTEAWMRGDIDVPEIADKWAKGPAVPIEILVPAEAKPGEAVNLGVSITNNKPGHEFPTGPLDILQAWMHVTVTDASGKVVYESGQRDARHFIVPGTFMFKAEPVDQYGNLIDKHNLWEMVGVRYKRAVFPGFSDQAKLGFTAPSAPGPLHIKAELSYCKFDQYLLDFLFGADSGLTAPVTVISTDQKDMQVVSQTHGTE